MSIALIPSVTLLAVGVGASTYLAVEAFQLRDQVADIRTSVDPSIDYLGGVQEERRLSLLVLSGDNSARDGLAKARSRLDSVMGSPEMNAAAAVIAEIAPETVGRPNSNAEEAAKAFAQVRQGVDAGVAPADQVYLFYNSILDRFIEGLRGLVNNLPEAEAVADGAKTVELMNAEESMSRGNAIGVAVVDTMTPTQLHEYARLAGSYHDRIAVLLPALDPGYRARVTALVESNPWKTLSTMEDAIVERGLRGGPLPVSVADWQSAAATVNTELADLFNDHHVGVVEAPIDSAQETATWWLVAGIVMLVGVLLAGLITLRISGQLIRRLKRLRSEALSVADEHLPRIMTRLRDGEDVDVTSEIKPLDFGPDEIGDVAEAFNRAESAAVSAAVEEARTRGGINALFLNIAHRSQIVVHRQLELLDKAEHREEDPNRLAVLFELDHLSTRARRNAENLIILGGEQPGRQWRHPVPLIDLVRSAIAETEDYARVHTGHMAAVSIVGSVVADLIHLIAELVENATSFSPPETRIEVIGSIVGRGVVVEVIDQGLGMSSEQIAQANATLLEPPNLGIANLSSDSRMGLIVVGRIAARNGVTIRLTESDYGGIRAIVLIPTSLIVASDGRPIGIGAAGGVGATEGNGAAGVPAARIPAASWPAAQPVEPAPYAGVPEPGVARREPMSAAPQEFHGHGVVPTAGRPALPRRRRQASLAQQLTESPPQQRSGGRHQRSAEQSRDLFSAIEAGTRRGRMARPAPDTNHHDGREGQQ